MRECRGCLASSRCRDRYCPAWRFVGAARWAAVGRVLLGIFDGGGNLVLLEGERMLRVISTGDPTSRKKLWVWKSNAKAAMPPMAAPTVAPMMVFFAVLPGAVTLEERQPGGGPLQLGGSVLVMVLGWELAVKCPIKAPDAGAACGKGKSSDDVTAAGVLEGVAITALHSYGAGYCRNVAVGVGD